MAMGSSGARTTKAMTPTTVIAAVIVSAQSVPARFAVPVPGRSARKLPEAPKPSRAVEMTT
jgi:hypothetical protein